ncbi:COG4223 family protein [Bartonella doshiae]|uniref:COG4223 family protein n=1 Tax=Bartonella doshiae TaxID=33044 RepID=UPI000942AFB2|nr:hypothetical protein [Bartonella doshiae]
MVDSSKSKVKPHYAGAHRKKTVIEHDTVSHVSEQTIQNTVELDAVKKKSKQHTQKKCLSSIIWIGLPISGFLGGVIALGLLIGLQWVGLSSSLLENHAGGEKALQIAETAKTQVEETMEKLERLFQEIDALKTEFASFSSQHAETLQGDEVSQENSRKVFLALEEKIKSLEESVQILSGNLKDTQKALFVGQSNANDLVALKEQLQTMQEKIVAEKGQKKEIDTALFIAMSALKSAVERGGSYSNELKILQQLSPSIEGLDLLEKTANIGLPNSVQLSTDFASVADAIVGTQNNIASDAHFGERIWTWIKGLIISRPIGNVEGMSLGAIAARMEVAVQMGDYEKALSEWQTLPQSAKDVSVDFVHRLEKHIAVHHLLQKLLMSVQQGSLKATEM